MLWSSCTPAKGKNARSHTLGSFCQPGHPTHLGSEVLPTNSVLGAVGVILVPPVQVQLCGTVAGWQALDVHARGQLQLHCGEWRGDLQSQVDITCLGSIQGAHGYSKVETRETRLRVRNWASFPENTPVSLKQSQQQQHLPGSPWKMGNDGRNTDTRPTGGCLFTCPCIAHLTVKLEPLMKRLPSCRILSQQH